MTTQEDKKQRKSEYDKRRRSTPESKEVTARYNAQYTASREGKAARARYVKSDKGKAARARYIASNPEKPVAQSAVAHALKTGRLVRPDVCEHCGDTTFTEASHTDYRRKLNVEWLCHTCHLIKDKK